MSVDELYQEIILDHYRNPRNKGVCTGCTRRVHHDNPVCGDEIDLGVELETGCIKHVSFAGHGCAISQASASMLTEAVRGLPVERALALTETVRQTMHGAPPADELGDLAALGGVSQFPLRIKCALLAWSALADALSSAEGETA
jgi:nitrogen fixation protein NifU and related proteins